MTATGTDPNGYTLESDPNLVLIADPHQYKSSSSSVDVKPACTHNGTTDPSGFVTVYMRSKALVKRDEHFKEQSSTFISNVDELFVAFRHSDEHFNENFEMKRH